MLPLFLTMLVIHKKYLLWHIIGSLSFLALPILISPHPPEETNYLYSPPTIRDFTANLLMVAFFYSNYYLFIPRFYMRKMYVLYGVIIAVSLVSVSLLPSLFTGYIPWLELPPTRLDQTTAPQKPVDVNYLTTISHNILLFASVVLFSILLRVREQLYKLEKAKNQMELGALRDQINPHFLFNTLNSIYAMAMRDKATGAAKNILKLSGLMRYVVSETNTTIVPLKKEMNYINDYIQLQRMRLDEQIKLNYSVDGEPNGQQVAPLILIPFIENAFKHGVNPDEDSQIDIRIRIEEKRLTLIVVNKKVAVHHKEYEQSGLGIENTKLRLNLLYPSSHDLFLSDDKDTFRVVLTIDLDD